MRSVALSINEYINSEIECEDLIECVSNSKQLDKEIYFLILERGKSNIDEIAIQVERERSTVYRSVQRLKENGFLEQEKVSQEGGGYKHVYTAVDPEKVAEEMQNKLNEWYAEVGQLIHEFKNKYGKE